MTPRAQDQGRLQTLQGPHLPVHEWRAGAVAKAPDGGRLGVVRIPQDPSEEGADVGQQQRDRHVQQAQALGLYWPAHTRTRICAKPQLRRERAGLVTRWGVPDQERISL